MVSGPPAQDYTGMQPLAAARAVRACLEEAGCPDADYDARELVRLATGKDPRLAFAPLTAPQAVRLAELAARRAAREPLQYLAGEWGFLGLTLKVGPGVLCPRPDSEVVCETAIRLLREAQIPAPRVLDLCAGTGCLGLGVHRFVPDARVICVEKSPEAFAYLQANAEDAGAACVQADVRDCWRTLKAESLDLILSNPPYLTAAEMAALMPETAHEPAMALDGGADGLEFYRLIAEHYRCAVRPGGFLVLEIGCTQRAAVQDICRAAGWRAVRAAQDYGGNDRVVYAVR